MNHSSSTISFRGSTAALSIPASGFLARSTFAGGSAAFVQGPRGDGGLVDGGPPRKYPRRGFERDESGVGIPLPRNSCCLAWVADAQVAGGYPSGLYCKPRGLAGSADESWPAGTQ